MNDQEWADLKSKVEGCRKCEIRATCKRTVFGAGNSDHPKIVLVGEAPGETEDDTGVPFVGRAGKELDHDLKAARIDRAKVFITNVVKCRPPQNRTPEAEEVRNCSTYLMKQLEHLKPRIIVALGAEAAAILLQPSGRKVTLTNLRGKVHPGFLGRVIATWHPSYYVRTNSDSVRREIIRDLKLAKAESEL